ncbi:Acetoin utilization deacetylase AcuC [Alteromonadaceae bacterium Bs31]|nr:Acetoin utilization deacetylase AcuC [Alteromonadaceae bacterium Bs31]
MSQCAFITHSICAKHDMGDGHPECPERLAAINDALISARLMDFLQVHDAQLAEDRHLARAHTAEHIALVRQLAPEQGDVALDADTSMNRYSLEAALRAAGAVVQACDMVMAGQVKSAFCAVRPPGHHAEYDRAMGFCIFNNIAVGAYHALEEHGLERVVIVDFDVHHGNGTEHIFADEKRVLLCSSYQHPFFPYSYGPSIAGQRINVPLNAGSGSEEFRAAVVEQWLPAIEQFEPQMIFFSAGFDAHRMDPLANLHWSEEDFGWVTAEVKKLANRHSAGRIVSSLEGGYDLHALGVSTVAHISALLGL